MKKMFLLGLTTLMTVTAMAQEPKSQEQTKVEEGKLIVEYYDTNILESTCNVHSNRTVKLKKKTKLFI